MPEHDLPPLASAVHRNTTQQYSHSGRTAAAGSASMSSLSSTPSSAIQKPRSTSLSTRRDVRKATLCSEIDSYFKSYLSPGYGKVTGVADLHFPERFLGSESRVADDDDSDSVKAARNPEQDFQHQKLIFTGTIWEEVDGVPRSSTRICALDLTDGEIQVITNGGGGSSDRYGRWRPDGKQIAFLSDRDEKGIFGVYVLEVGGLAEARRVRLDVKEEEGREEEIPKLEGSAEWLQWSPDGKKLLVGFAGLDADAGDAEGSGKVGRGREKEEVPSWMPTVDAGVREGEWRIVAVWNVGDEKSYALKLVDGETRKNVWEAAWVGSQKILALVSDAPGEEAWYGADVVLYDLALETMSTLKGTQTQHGLLTGSPSGKRYAFVEGLASDRGVMAGDVKYCDLEKDPVTLHTVKASADVTYLTWRDDDVLFYTGNDDLESVVGDVYFYSNQPPDSFAWWTSPGCGGAFAPSGFPLPGSAFAVAQQSWSRHPEIGIVVNGDDGSFAYTTLRSLSHPGAEHLSSLLGEQRRVCWNAPDGLRIQGFLQLPKKGKAPHPLILNVHGGPVASWRDQWPGISFTALLNARGYAVLAPNPRGSSSRGQDYSTRILGNVGGEETLDHLSGIDMLIEGGIADPDRIGVIGGSHGGFMASWIITQDSRFKASVPIAAVTDWHSFHTTTNIPRFTRLFFKADPYKTSTSESLSYLTRSPVMEAGKTKTPVLQMAGTEDACVSSSQAFQFHNALKEHGNESAVVLYPGQGHGIRTFPAIVDMCVRMVNWFETFMASR